MRFTYTYRSSDGERHAAEIEAESRDAAFVAVRRELGIKPIKVVAEMEECRPEGSPPALATAGGGNGRARAPLARAVAVLAAALALVAVAGGLWRWSCLPRLRAARGGGRRAAVRMTRRGKNGRPRTTISRSRSPRRRELSP